MTTPDWREEAKRKAAFQAAKLVNDNSVIGLGSGSTAALVIEELGRRVSSEKLRVLGVPTSYQAALAAAKAGVPLTSLDEHPVLDLAIDGADQVDRAWNAIKGGGGCLTREKIVASAAREFVVVVDGEKMVETLGQNRPVPVEVLPFAVTPVLKRLEQMGASPVLRTSGGKVGPTVTDNGNFILDADFGPIRDVRALEARVKMTPGVVEVGLFSEMIDRLIVGSRDGVRVYTRA
ncbi:MAG: ribose-5-phosphate isomerase RpiA [Candidatus Bathyarchaeia archaeon]